MLWVITLSATVGFHLVRLKSDFSNLTYLYWNFYSNNKMRYLGILELIISCILTLSYVIDDLKWYSDFSFWYVCMLYLFSFTFICWVFITISLLCFRSSLIYCFVNQNVELSFIQTSICYFSCAVLYVPFTTSVAWVGD